MKVRLKMLTLLGLLALVAAWFFWPRSSAPVAQAPSSAATAPAAVAAVAAAPAAATNAVAAEDLGVPSAATTNRLAFRLSNTARTGTKAGYDEFTREPHAVLLENALIDTTAALQLKIPAHLQAAGEPGAFIVQSRGALDNAFRAAIGAAGGSVISYIPNNALLVQISSAGAAVLAGNSRVQAVLPYEPYYKVSSTLLGRAVQQQPLPVGTLLTLGLYDRGSEATLAELEKLGAKVLTQERSPFGQMVRVIPPADWTPIAKLSGVQLVSAAYRRQVANDLSRPAVGQTANSITTTNYLGLSGLNVLVEVNDTGIDPAHPDFSQTTNGGLTRVTGAFAESVVDVDGHGTHVAGIIAGNGRMSSTVVNARGSVTNANFRGKAPDARLFSVGFLGANDTNVAVSDSYLQEAPALTNALISNNSWRYTGDSEYDLPAASYDAAMRDALPQRTGPQPVLFVFAGGNEGGGNDAGSGGAADSIQSPATAKNVITVGALEELRNITNIVTSIDGVSNAIWAAQTDSGFQVAGYSSRGNVGIDTEGSYGRFKPDVVAPGTFTISTRSTTWDEGAYYSITNYHENTVNDDFVTTNTLAYGSITIPQNAVGVQIRIVANSQSPTPFPNSFPIYVSRTGIPDPNNASTYDIFKTGTGVSIPPDSGGTISGIGILKNGGISYAIGDPTNFPVSFDVQEIVITTNDLGNQMEVMSNLNNSISGAAPHYYRYETGTSMAAPAVSGVLACMQDFFTNRLQLTPSPALLKAMLINGARVAGSYKYAVTNTINYQGWGLVKLSNSIPLGLTNLATAATNSIFFVDQSPTNALATGDRRIYNLTVPTALGRAQPLRVTLAWTDPPGNPAAAVKLVNDLDLVVTNLSNGQVFRGNSFSQSGTPPFSVAGGSNSVADNINNVENVYLSPTLGTNYSVAVVARAVNVNAVTLEQTNIVQDFALVITSGDGNNTNGFSVTAAAPQPAMAQVPHVDYLPSTNGIYFNQIAGANAPWLQTNDIVIGPGYTSSGFFTNSVYHVGQTNQWHFYVVTNTFAATNAAFTNAAFIIFLPNTQATPREGVFAESTANSTRTEADLELMVASAPDPLASQLTNLNFTVISNCLFNTGGDGSSIGRGGQEFVVFSNSTANQIYYIGVHCQDQMAGQYAFVPIFSDQPFSTQDSQGNVYVNGLNLPVNIPDGNNAHPGVAYVFGLCLATMDVGRVVVTNTFEHENFGDLFGALSHAETSAILNNHDGLGTVVSSQEFIYDDSGRGDIVGVRHSDGPGSLNQFRGKPAAGAWVLNQVDNSYTATGAITGFKMKIEPHRDFRKQPFAITVSVPPGGWFYDYIDVPTGYTNLLVVATNLPPTAAPPIELYVKEGDTPLRTDTNYFALLVNGTPPGNSVSVGPPLVPDRYFIGLFNPDTVSHDVLLGAVLTFDASAVLKTDWNSSGPLHLLDDAVTYDSIFVTDTNTIQDFQIGLRVDHERISDLVFHLITPSGARYLLMENRGGQSTNGCGATIITTNIINQTAGGNAVAQTNSVNVGITHGTFPITYDFYIAPDQMTVYYGTNIDPAYLVYDTGMTNGAGTIVVAFPPPGISANSTYLSIVMNQYGPTPRATRWDYTAGGIQTNYAYLSFTEDTALTTTPIKFAPPPFVPQTVTNIFFGTNFVYSTNYVFSTNITYVTNFFYTTNISYATNFVFSTNITYVTNISYATNVSYSTNTTSLETFEGATTGEYAAVTGISGATFSVTNNQVSVVNDAANAHAGSRFVALASGTITRPLATTAGVTNVLTFAYRGPGIADWWRAENNAIGAVNGNNGTLQNGGVTFSTGEVGSSFNMNGVNGFVLVNPTNSTLDVGKAGGFTMEGWIKPTTVSLQQVLVYYMRVVGGTSGSDPGMNFALQGNTLVGSFAANIVDTSSGSHVISSPAGALVANVWQHVGLTYDKASGNSALYVNGASVASANLGTFTPQTTYTNVQLGCSTYFASAASPNNVYSGLMDELSFYRRALSASELKAIYTAGTNGKFDPFAAVPQNLAEARVSITGFTTNVFFGSNTNWQTNTFTFVATNVLTPLKLDGLQPGMLLDSFALEKYLPAATNTVPTTNVISSTNITTITNVIGTTNIVVAGTNVTATTNVTVALAGGVTNFISTFDSVAPGDYVTASTVDGWSVSNNQVSVVNDPTNARSGSQFLALANGSISANLPTTPGAASVLTVNYRGPGAAGWWKGDFNTSDAIGGDNGTLIGGAGYAGGVVSTAFSYDGTDDYMTVNGLFPFHTANSGSIDFWVNPNGGYGVNAYQCVFWTRDTSTPDENRFNFYIKPDSTFNFDYRSISGSYHPLVNDIPVASNAWTHLAVTRVGNNTYAVYTNGTAAATVVDASPELPDAVGWRFSGLTYDEHEFNGQLDEVTTYGRALSASEIKAIYQAGSNGKYDHAAAAPQNLAKARITLTGQGSTTYYGDNNNWTTVTIPFTPTTTAATLQIDGLEPGMLLDSIQVVTAPTIATNYTTNIVVTTSNLYYLPEQDISGINGTSPYGEWKLEILDNRAGATNFGGNLLGWQMEFTYANTNFTPPPVLPNLSTNYYSVIESNLFVLTNTATYSVSNATLIYTLSGPTNATIDTNGVITWFPLESQAPDTNVFVTTVRDAANPTKVAQNFFQVVALESNLPPIILFPTNNQVLRILEPDSAQFFVTNLIGFDSDIPTNNLVFALVGVVNVTGQPATNLIVTPDGTLGWQMDETTGPGTNIIIVSLTDTNPYLLPPVLLLGNQPSYSVTNTFTLVVQESNRPPVLFVPTNSTVDELVAFSAQATATDPDWPTNTLAFGLVGVVPALTGSQLTVSSGGLINWTPDELQGPGDYTVFVKVTDFNPWAVNAQNLSTTNSFVIHVNEINVPPFLATNLPDTNIVEMQTLTVNNPATDPDAPFNTFTYTLVVSPAVTNAFISTNGVITWTPTEAQGPGDYLFTTIVTDTNPPAVNQTSFTVQNSFIVHVLETNSAPFWTNSYPLVVMDEFTITNVSATAIDTDLPPNLIIYSIGTNAVTTNVPAWISIDPVTGVVSLAPLDERIGPSTNLITVIATDNGTPALSATTAFTVIVNEVNLPPVPPTIPDQYVYAGEQIVVDDSAADPDLPVNFFNYELLAGPAGLLLDTNTGIVTWQTATNTPQGTNLVTVKVTDFSPWALINQSYSRTNSFNIIVLAPFTNTFTTGIPAFPGAEGAGGYAIGGRGGDVYHVTNTNDSGPGSLRNGVTAAHRTIVFDVSGTINLLSDLKISQPYLTIAGQTAPGDGITVKGLLTSVQDTHNVEVRFLRFRPGDVNCTSFQDDAFHFRGVSNSIVDHLSASWSIDEVLSATYCTNVTVQWSMIADALNDSCHEKGPHGYGSLLRYGDGSISYHHNLYADNNSRNPRLGDNLTLDFVNNVVANWGILPGYSEDDTADNPGGFINRANYIANYLIAGTNTALVSTAFRSGTANSWIYQSNNLIDPNLDGALNGANTGWGMFSGPLTQSGTPFAMPAPAVTVDTAQVAYERVLAFVGATATKRDLVDSNIVRNVRAQTGRIINSQNEVGGWPALASTPNPLDTDQDGMPDFWETLLGLNKNVASDGNLTNSTGYTRLEEYLNWLANPHAMTSTNTAVDVDLQVVAGSTGSLAFSVANGTNGTVTLLGDGHTARFTPALDYGGFASFNFNVTDTATGIGFGPVSVSIVVLNGLVIPNLPTQTNGFMLVQYNVKGNGATDWSTNAAQVQAIGRELAYLNPDIITFNEIPVAMAGEMANWANGFLSGYTVVVSPGNDGFIGSAIASRFPVTRTASWLDAVDLDPYGYTASDFTRDLFEAQIIVPGFAQPLHVFTTHLKSSASGYADAALKRAAECAAITNFIATNMLALYPNDLYTLSGDMNEGDTNSVAIQRLVNSAAGLRVTNPTNQFTGSINTFSSATPGSRIDYIMPCVALASNIVGAQVFRTSVFNPVPSGLNADDDQVASDHLPVLMAFNSPYPDSVTLTNDVPETNTIPPGGIVYRRVNVPLNADIATNDLLFTTNGWIDVWFTTNTPPSIARPNDTLLLANTTGGKAILYTNTPPAITPGKTYYLGLHNTNTVPVGYALKVTFHFINSAPPVFNIFSIVQTNRTGTNGFLITWFAPTNYQFHLQWTPQLAPMTWTEMKGVISFDSYITATNSHFSYFDDGDTNRNSAPFGPTRFYRLHLLNSPTNTPPVFLQTLTAATNFTVAVTSAFVITNNARDWDLPPQTLSYAVSGSLAGTNLPVIDANGVINWTPTSLEAGQTNLITTVVTDNGLPVQRATNNFKVIVPSVSFLISRWPLDENAGIVAHDVGPAHNDGTLTNVGTGTFAWTNGIAGSAIALAGTIFGDGGFVTAGNPASLDFDTTNVFTVSAWMKTTGVQDSTIVGKMRQGSGFAGYELHYVAYPATNYIIIWLINDYIGNKYIDVRSGIPVNDGNWHQVAFSYDGSGLAAGVKIFVDGKLDAASFVQSDTLGTNSIQNSTNFNIGSRSDGQIHNFTGSIDEVQVYNTVLSSNNIYALFANPTAVIASAVAPAGFAASTATNGFALQWTAPAYEVFQVQWATNLAPVNWFTFPNLFTSTNGTFTFTDTNVFWESKFYRLLLLP